jgi:hypothetical protein
LNSLIGLLHYETIIGKDPAISAARKRGEEYLLQRKLMVGLANNEPVGRWVTEFTYPSRWRYSAVRALNYFRDASAFDHTPADPRLSAAVESVRLAANAHGRWLNQRPEKGSVWFDVDAPVGEESKWITYYALRALKWWDARTV